MSLLSLSTLALVLLGAAAQDVPPPDAAPGHPAAALDCAVCHVNAEPTAEAAALKPCPRNMPLGAHENDEAPDVFLMDELTDLYVPVVFPHKLHASMTNMGEGCDVCHHHNPPGPILTCKACHNGPSNPGNLRQPGLKGAYHRQCLGCHREWTHETDCVTCHAKRVPGKTVTLPKDSTDIMGVLHPNVEIPDKRVYKVKDEGLADTPYVTFHHNEHVQLFGLKCVSCHQRENCNTCHEIGGRVPHVRQDPHQDCIKCHQDNIEGDCTYCHQAQPVSGFDHTLRSKFPLKPYHARLRCDKCHSPGRVYTGLNADCGACHAPEWNPANFDHAKTGQALNEIHILIGCLDCHKEGIGRGVSCADCHDDGRNKFPPPEAPTINASGK